jgi:hypothetical protein
MALISPTKKDDTEFLTVWADIIESTYRFYQTNPSPGVKEMLDGFIDTYNGIKTTIDTKDYTEDDRRYWELEALFKETQLSPGDQ